MTWFAAIAVSIGFLNGCGGDGRPKLVPVEGTVTINGEPLDGATVVFKVVDVKGDYARPSQAITDAQGKFKAGTYATDDGMPIGTYQVGIIKKELASELPADFNEEADPSQSGRPVRYLWTTPREAADPETSGLTAEVTRDGLKPNTFTLEGGGEVEVVGGGAGSVP
jgi:hypothetical protein